jgi:pyruvate formate lyase activating enzyme
VPWENVLSVIPYTGLFLTDLKHSDARAHKKWTGADNRLILDNLMRLSHAHPDIRVRIPLIPGVNDDESSLAEMAEILNGFGGGVHAAELLKFNHLAEGKYAALGKMVPFAPEPRKDGHIAQKGAFLRSHLRETIDVMGDW